MATVTLRKDGPRRINTCGIIFERDVPREGVPMETAEYLDSDARFKVKFSVDDVASPTRAEALEAQEEGETGKRIKPKNTVERYAAINAAADQLDLDNEAHFTKDGKPDARALSSILGWVVTSADRDAALKSVAPSDETPKKVTTNVTIRRRKDAPAPTETLADTGEDAAAEAAAADDTTDDAVEV